MIFSTSLSVAAFLRRAGGSMLESTGSHGRGVEWKVPEMRRMVEFNCTSTRLVWAERDNIAATKLNSTWSTLSLWLRTHWQQRQPRQAVEFKLLPICCQNWQQRGLYRQQSRPYRRQSTLLICSQFWQQSTCRQCVPGLTWGVSEVLWSSCAPLPLVPIKFNIHLHFGPIHRRNITHSCKWKHIWKSMRSVFATVPTTYSQLFGQKVYTIGSKVEEEIDLVQGYPSAHIACNCNYFTLPERSPDGTAGYTQRQ